MENKTRIEISLRDKKLHRKHLISLASDLCNFHELQPWHKKEFLEKLENRRKKSILEMLKSEFHGIEFIVSV
jgi:hypothetical protein